MTQHEVLKEVQTWPMENQLDFLFLVWDQLVDGGWQPELTDDLKAELNRRLASYEANPTNVVTWEQLVAKVRGQR
jgi:putative addiction module component (TIGR02574 family)